MLLSVRRQILIRIVGYPWDEWEGGIVIVSNWLVDAEFTYNEIGTSAVSFSSVTLTDSIMYAVP